MSGTETETGPGPRIDRRQFLKGSVGAAAAVALGMAGAGCGGGGFSSVSGRTVRLPLGALGFPSPFAANADLGYAQASYVYDTLLWKDGSGQLLPWLASGFTASADNLTYTFALRGGITWSDGRPLSATDVVFTFDYLAKQQTLSPPVIIQPPQGIASVSAPSPLSVEIKLDKARVTFLEQIAGAVLVVPQHVWSKIGDPGSAQDTKVLVGSSAYEVKQYNGDGGPMLYEARPGFFLGAPYVKNIEERSVNDAFTGLLGGDTDYASDFGLRSDIVERCKANPAFGQITNVGNSTQAMYWNLGKGNALADVRFRRAMLMAIDQQDLVTRICNGRGIPGNPGFLAPNNPWYSPVTQYGFDVAGANAALDAAGYRYPSTGAAVRHDSTGATLSFELLMDVAQAPLSEILVADLRRVGVELKPKLVPLGPQLFGNKLTGQYDVAVLQFPGPGPGGPSADPDVLRLLFSSRLPASLQGASDYANLTLDALADQQLSTFDMAERKSIVAQIQTILAEDVPLVPLYFTELDAFYRKPVVDTWYFTPGEFPATENNKQLFITGRTAGTAIRTI